MVGARRHAALGRDLRDAGLRAPLRRHPLGRARRDRAACLRGRVGPARAARPRPRARRRARPAPDPDGSGAGCRLHDRPTALELLEAARGALGEDVLPHARGRAAFQLRVSLRALGMVGRELEHTPTSTPPLHAAALARLGVAARPSSLRRSATERCRRREQELFGALRAIVARQARGREPRLSAGSDTNTSAKGGAMSEDPPAEVADLIEEIDAFIAAEIRPLEAGGRQRALLRPSPRARAHRLRGRRRAQRASGRPAR